MILHVEHQIRRYVVNHVHLENCLTFNGKYTNISEGKSQSSVETRIFFFRLLFVDYFILFLLPEMLTNFASIKFPKREHLSFIKFDKSTFSSLNFLISPTFQLQSIE
jgi:hypothetical protein